MGLENDYSNFDRIMEVIKYIANDQLELSYDKIKLQRDDWRKRIKELKIDDKEKPIVDIKAINFYVFNETGKEIITHRIVYRRQGEGTYTPIDIEELPYVENFNFVEGYIMTNKVKKTYLDALDAVNKVKNCPLTRAFENHKTGSGVSVYQYMVAMAEDIEREIKKRMEHHE